jgi:hypothetical protein
VGGVGCDRRGGGRAPRDRLVPGASRMVNRWKAPTGRSGRGANGTLVGQGASLVPLAEVWQSSLEPPFGNPCVISSDGFVSRWSSVRAVTAPSRMGLTRGPTRSRHARHGFRVCAGQPVTLPVTAVTRLTPSRSGGSLEPRRGGGAEAENPLPHSSETLSSVRSGPTWPTIATDRATLSSDRAPSTSSTPARASPPGPAPRRGHLIALPWPQRGPNARSRER